ASNDYTQLDLSLAVNAWNPTFAAYDASNAEYSLSAPQWTTSPGNLNFKFTRTNSSGNNGCVNFPCNSFSYIPLSVLAPAYDNCMGGTAVTQTTAQASLGVTATVMYVVDNPFSPDQVNVCNSGSPYRSSVSQFTGKVSETQLFPNPAHGYVQLTLKDDIDMEASVTAELWNIYGQRVAELYNGIAATVPGTQMQLPD